jgi:hypothetical protein
LVRDSLSAILALIYFADPGRLRFEEFEDRLWRLHSWAALARVAALFISPSSTAADRIALYVFPLQLAILARLPAAHPVQGMKPAIVAYSPSIQLVWELRCPCRGLASLRLLFALAPWLEEPSVR